MEKDLPPGSENTQSSPFHILLRRIVAVRPSETGALLYSFSFFFCLLCAYYLLRPLRDAMGLVGGTAKLPWLFTATFLAMIAAMPVFGAIATALPPRRFVPWVYRFFALNILGFGALFAAGIEEVAVSRVFFVWISVFNLFVISIFWSVMADRFSSEQGKRLFGFIAAGGTAGALLGPVMAAVLSVRLGVAGLTVIAAVLLELAVQSFFGLGRAKKEEGESSLASHGKQDDGRVGGGILAGVTLILRDRYLLGIALYLLLHTFASTVLYFEQGRIVAEGFSDTASRTRFFALTDLGVSVFSLLLQIGITGRLLQRVGIAWALIALPVVSILACAVLTVWPTVFALGAVQSLRRAIDYAVVRPARETLFIVVSRAAKYKAKSVIETVIYRGGDAVSGWMITSLAAIGIGFAGISAVFAPFAALWIWLSLRLDSARRERVQEASLEPQAKEKENETVRPLH
jgi:ATP:ADP antiporter, AAA family